MKQKYIYFSRIRNNEIPDMVRALLTVVNKHMTAAMGIKTFVDLLTERASNLSVLSTPSKKRHPLSGSIVNDRKKRWDLVKAILKQKSAIESGGVSTLLDKSVDLFPLVDKYLGRYSKQTTKTADDKLLNFISEVEGSEDLQNAARDLGISIYMEELKALQPSLTGKVDQRRVDNSARRQLPASQVRKETLSLVTNLLKAIELAEAQHADLDFSAFDAELEEMMVPYNASIRARETRSRNAADKNATVASSTTTTATAN